MIDITRFMGLRLPMLKSLSSEAIVIKSKPRTDLWQRTYYGFQNDNAPIFYMEVEEAFFSFTVRTAFEYRKRYDQCGIVIYQDSENWLKASIEYENENFQRLGSVVTNHGYSDWATVDIPASAKEMTYRLSRRNSDFLIECSEDGETFKQMRICHLFKGEGKIRLGIYACSPEDSSFEATFSELEFGACKWEAHK